MMSDDPQELFELYAPEALAVERARVPKLPMPLPMYIRESFQITQRAVAYWERGPEEQPGLKIAASRYTQAQTARHQGILTALSFATGLGLIKLERRAVVGPKVARAQVICDEIEAACAFVLDDGVEDEDDLALASMQEAEERLGEGAAALGQLLIGWTALAGELEAKLAQLGDWDGALIAEGEALAQELLGAVKDSAVPDEEATRIKRARQGLLALAHEEMGALRRAASYVWRNHPTTRQQFFSEIERKKRARNRALKAAAGK